MKKKVIVIITVMIIFFIGTIAFLKFNCKEKMVKSNEEEIILEEQYNFLNTMTEEEKDAIIKNKEDREKLNNRTLYSYLREDFVISLKEIRFVENYIKENYSDLEVVYEGVMLNSRDTSLLSNKGSDVVIVHLKNDTKKYPKQYTISLKIDEEGNYIVVKDNFKNIN